MTEYRPGVIVPPSVTSTQRRVLDAVRRRGEVTAVDVATDLGITTSGSRQHLATLAEMGLIEMGLAPRVPGQQGRTEGTYRTTPAADSLFPNAYAELLNDLLAHLPADAVTAAFERRRDDRIASARPRLVEYRALGAKVAQLIRVLNEDGYLASVEPIGRNAFLIVERNCPIAAVADAHPQVDATELEFLRRALPGAQVERVTHGITDHHTRAYEVRTRR